MGFPFFSVAAAYERDSPHITGGLKRAPSLEALDSPLPCIGSAVTHRVRRYVCYGARHPPQSPTSDEGAPIRDDEMSFPPDRDHRGNRKDGCILPVGEAGVSRETADRERAV